MATFDGRVFTLTPADVGTVIWTPNVLVKFIDWYDATTVGHKFILATANGRTILSAIAEGAGTSQTFNLENWFEGLSLQQLDSGTVYIHVK
jgi:hypothetical protein